MLEALPEMKILKTGEASGDRKADYDKLPFNIAGAIQSRLNSEGRNCSFMSKCLHLNLKSTARFKIPLYLLDAYVKLMLYKCMKCIGSTLESSLQTTVLVSIIHNISSTYHNLLWRSFQRRSQN